MKFAENSKLKTDLKIKNQISKFEPAGPGGKVPALAMSTGLSTGLSTGESTALSTCLSTRGVEPLGLGAPGLVFWLGLGCVLETS